MKSLLSRTGVNRTLALTGILVILLQVLMIADTRVQVTVVLGGIILNQLGVWGLANRLFPERRKYLLLRSEVDHFLTLVRKLNSSAVAGAEPAVQSTTDEMHESVERMANVAGTSSDDEGSDSGGTSSSESSAEPAIASEKGPDDRSY